MRVRKGSIVAVAGRVGDDARGCGGNGFGYFDRHRSVPAGLGQDAVEQFGGGLWPRETEHLEPCSAALRVRHHGATGGAFADVAVEGGLVRGGENAVERVGEEGLALLA